MDNSNWKVIGASIAGKGHRNKDNDIIVECQDSHSYQKFGDWTILIVSDGAGSYENSKKGSQFCVDHIPMYLHNKLLKLDSFCKENSINESQWREVSLSVFEKTLEELKKLAEKAGIDYKTLGCTVNLVLFNEEIIYSAHIGDGRGAYRKNDNETWKALFTPFTGDEPGMTVFITSDYCWENVDLCIDTNIFKEKLSAVCLLSDGMESYSFTCYTKNEETEMFYDPNEPHSPFLNSNIKVLNKMLETETIKEVSDKWESYLENGKKLSEEYDDKTMIVAFK